MISRVDGPECPACGCRASTICQVGRSLWGNVEEQRVCDYCKTQFPARAPEDQYSYEYSRPACRKCGSPMNVASTDRTVRYLRCSNPECGETGKAVRT